jgi:hypothetical protein
MRSKLGLPLIFLILVGFGASGLTLSNRNKANTGQDQAKPDLNNFPLVDYEAVRESDPNKDERRQKKSKKYNSKHAPRITESSNQIFHIIDWDMRLPALPVARSAAIVIGEITDARAYLSEDGTNIYSEFSIRADEILKNDIGNPLVLGNSIIAQREGGRVRFASGKTVTATVNHQDMPRTGRRYVVFLTHSFPLGRKIEDFYMLTAYELRAGRVFPLDNVLDDHPIAAYKGTSELSFLTDLRVAIGNSER